MIERTNRGGLSTRGAFRLGRVLKVYLAGTVPVCDVVEPDTGSIFLGCRFVSGMGGPTSTVHAPPEGIGTAEIDPKGSDGSEVFLLFPAGFHGPPKVVGSQTNPALYALFSEALTSDPATDADYPAGDDANKIGLADYVVQRAGARFIMTPSGDLVFDARAVEKPVRVQVKAGQALRISVDGAAEERVLLAGPLMAYLTSVAERINHIGRALKTAELWMSQFVTGTITQTTPNGIVQTPVLEYMQFTATGLTVTPTGLFVQDAQSPGPDYAGNGAFPGPSNLMVASAVQVSARSLKDDEDAAAPADGDA